MHESVQNLINIKEILISKSKDTTKSRIPEIIAVSKTFKEEHILPLLEHGHLHFGENKIQESIDKWSSLKKKYPKIYLHFIGKLQTNKVKLAVNLFDYIHSLDNIKLAQKIANEQVKQKKKIKIFIQVNLGKEEQKSGISKENLYSLLGHSKKLDLDIIGLMCIPPVNESPDKYFQELRDLNLKSKLTDLSMGMSSDYLKAAENSATFVRIGSNIFGERI